MQFIEYKVSPVPYEERAILAACLYFDVSKDYFINVYVYEYDDDGYNYRMGLLCYLLKQAMYSDFAISVFLLHHSVSDVRYFLSLFEMLIDQDISSCSDYNNVSLLADKLNVKKVSVPIIYISSSEINS